MRHVRSPFTRLAFEELESRSLLAVMVAAPVTVPTSDASSSVPALFGSSVAGAASTISDTLVPTIAAAGFPPGSIANPTAASSVVTTPPPANVSGSVALGTSPAGVAAVTGNSLANQNPNALLGFDATSGNGQITLTTGANTLGIRGFAMPTVGVRD